jgi:hypothetical protein
MITIIKLSNGIEIVGKLVDSYKDVISIEKPLQINYRYFLGATPSVSFVRYVMFSKTNTIAFNRRDIINETEARTSFADYYTSVVDYYFDELEKQIDAEFESLIDSESTNKEQQMKRILEMMPTDDTPVN